MRLLIRNGHVIDIKNGLNGKLDVLIWENRIADISRGIDPGGCQVIDASGKYVLPGLVDMHCHLRDPGYEYKEDIISGTRSAAMGGFTSVACMPNTNPPTDNKTVVRYILDRAKREGAVNVYPIGAITKGLAGLELAEMGEMKAAGAVAVSDDGNPVKNAGLMKKAMLYASMFGLPVISHCEDPDLSDEGVMNEGYQSTVMGLKGTPTAAEEVVVAREVILSEYTGVPVHIAHVSTALSVEIIRWAKKRGVKVTAETCPHYFSLTEEACRDFNTLAKVNPPLRTARDMEAVIEGLKDGTIDVIATDHAPHHQDEKNVEFNLAKSGMVGFESAFSLAVTYLLKPGHLTLGELVEKMCANSAKILGIDKGTLEVGKEADITIVDLDREWLFKADELLSKSRNTPFDGFCLKGKVCWTIVGGKVVVSDGELVL